MTTAFPISSLHSSHTPLVSISTTADLLMQFIMHVTSPKFEQLIQVENSLSLAHPGCASVH